MDGGPTSYAHAEVSWKPDPDPDPEPEQEQEQEDLGAWASDGAAVLPPWGSSLAPASCLSSRPRHIPVPLDPHGDMTASFGAFGAWLRSLRCVVRHPV